MQRPWQTCLLFFLFLSSTEATFLVVERYPQRRCSSTFLCLSEFLMRFLPEDSWYWNAAFGLWIPCALYIVCIHMPLPKDQAIILTILSAVSWNLPHSCLYQGNFCLHSFDFKISVVAFVCPAPGWSATPLKYIHFKEKHITLYYIFHSG